MSQSSPSYSVERYTAAHKNAWNQLVRQAKNATFLFDRDFMDYHSDRFQDASLLIYKASKLIGLLPANQSGTKVYSHQGLSYGGLVLSPKTKFGDVLEMFKQVLLFLEDQGVQSLQLKLLPKIYHRLPSDEIDYLLFLTQATRTRVDVSATVASNNRLKIQGNRLEGVKKAEKKGLSIVQADTFSTFWNHILIPNLAARHDAAPVHSLVEITRLAQQFPKHIKQFNVIKDNQIVAGATLFITKMVAHVQYISASEDKQQLGSLDFLFHHLITESFADVPYFDFGISNENQGKNINRGLQYWKECFGARSIVHEFYEVATANHKALEEVYL